MVVDDSEDVREAIMAVLNDEGWSVVTADNGRHALDLLDAADHLPDLMLLDLMMPVMSGYELLDVLAERNLLGVLPVVVLSAGGNASKLVGARRFVRKPITYDALVGLAEEFCPAQ